VSISEFQIIERYFNQFGPLREDVVLGIGDDAAILEVPVGRQLVVAIDTLVAGRHFPEQSSAFDIGYKSLAVNLSDLAAMGAGPAWATLSLTLPHADEQWLAAFAQGFFHLAARYQMDLVGGDTTRGPLSITVQVSGLVKSGKALRRDSARPGQRLFVTGTPGDAAYALQQLEGGGTGHPELLKRLHRPEPRVDFGLALCDLGAAVVDVSDGLLADLEHIVSASHCGATVWVDRLPRSRPLQALAADDVLDCQLQGGDDYELCFALDAGKADKMQKMAERQRLRVTEIGVIEQRPGVRCKRDNGAIYCPRRRGYDHFLNDGCQ
jgi:thiamine-monophosphate kinase